MPSDLENNLVEGGLTPLAAKVIANALDNAATERVNTGRNLADVTPVERMRLIDSDARRYLLTHLDYPPDSPFRNRVSSEAGRSKPPKPDHPYRNSQPSTANPTLSTPSVTGGKFVSVATGTKNDVAQTEVSLRIATRGGSHARLNTATGEVEAVPILLEVEPQNRLEATVEERPDATVIKLRFLT